MIAHEFQADVRSGGTLQLPEDIASQLAPGMKVRVLILVADPDEESDWKRLTTEQFFKGYADGDAIYDQYPNG